MTDWNAIEKGLNSTDHNELAEMLDNIVLDNVMFDDEYTKKLLPICVDKLTHHDIKVRSHAMGVVAKQFRDGNTGVVYVMDQLAKALGAPNLLDLKDGAKQGGEVYSFLHKDLCFTIREVQKQFPGKMMPHFAAVVNYLIQAVSSRTVDISTAACEYWSNQSPPSPVPGKYMTSFMSVIQPKLQKLVPYLINAMEYQKQHEAYLETKTRESGSAFRPKTSSKELEQFVSRRNFAAMAFENICGLFQLEALGIFKMNLLANMKSDKWQQVEAATLALGAFTQALGVPKEMQDVYGEVLNKIIDNFKHTNSLVRSISFFTMQKFTNAKLKGVKNPFSRTLKGTLTALSDNSMEVQEMALRCLANLLALTEQDLQPHAAKIHEALVNADVTTFGESRQAYYECIGHYFTKLGGNLDAEQVEEVSMPLINEWNNLGWNNLEASSHESVMILCQSLVAVSVGSRLKFATHNPAILEKCMPFLNKLASSNDQSLQRETTTVLTVSFLDVISSIFQGQPTNVEKLINRYSIDKCVMKILQNNKFDSVVRGGAMALTGYICEHSYDSIKANIDNILDIIVTMIKSKTINDQINALWTLVHVSQKVEEGNEKLISLADQLAVVFMNMEGEEKVIVNAALSLSYIGVKNQKQMFQFFARDDIFIHMFALLHADFEDAKAKMDILNNLLLIYRQNIKQIKPELWCHFCIAAAQWDFKDEELSEMIKETMKNVRTTLGVGKWKDVNEKVGRQTSASIRKRYKLY